MARPKRRVGRLIVFFLLLGAVGFAIFQARRKSSGPVEDRAPAPVFEAAPAWRAGPGQAGAFSDTLGVRLEGALTALGIAPEKIRRVRSKRDEFSFETAVDVPKDLPLAVCNLEITRLAEGIGGGTLNATEALGGLAVTMQMGLGGRATDRILLQTDPNTTRPAGVVALVVCGTAAQDKALLKGFCDLEQPITLALWPDQGASREVTARAAANGHGVMLHLPMNGLREQVGAVLRRAVEDVPDAEGVVNDLAEGRISEDERAVSALLSEVRRKGMFFVDGHASGASVAYRTALRMRVRCGESVMRVDEEDSAEMIRAALGRLADLSGSEGRVFATAYARSSTLAAFREALPALERRGVRFVRAEQIVKR